MIIKTPEGDTIFIFVLSLTYFVDNHLVKPIKPDLLDV